MERVFLMGQIRKIQKHKKERMEETKRRDFLCKWRFPYLCVLHPHTHVFSNGQEHPRATALL
jgi:hypothetical protein